MNAYEAQPTWAKIINLAGVLLPSAWAAYASGEWWYFFVVLVAGFFVAGFIVSSVIGNIIRSRYLDSQGNLDQVRFHSAFIPYFMFVPPFVYVAIAYLTVQYL